MQGSLCCHPCLCGRRRSDHTACFLGEDLTAQELAWHPSCSRAGIAFLQSTVHSLLFHKSTALPAVFVQRCASQSCSWSTWLSICLPPFLSGLLQFPPSLSHLCVKKFPAMCKQMSLTVVAKQPFDCHKLLLTGCLLSMCQDVCAGASQD